MEAFSEAHHLPCEQIQFFFSHLILQGRQIEHCKGKISYKFLLKGDKKIMLLYLKKKVLAIHRKHSCQFESYLYFPSIFLGPS